MSQGSATSSAKSFSPPFTVIAMHNNKTASAQNGCLVKQNARVKQWSAMNCTALKVVSQLQSLELVDWIIQFDRNQLH